ncbi:MAG: xylose isomerase [Pseudomonadota bacterium]|jgi:sugar phosphate isomerase/epimerase|nr:xylose isomerase [Pseudomonadota bacterium]
MPQKHQIKRGVSLYSFQEEYFLRTLDLEGCIATCAKLGAYGIESIGEQMMPGFPHLPDSFYMRWHDWMRQYGTVPTCHDMFLDTKRYKDRLLTDDEMIASIRTDLRHSAKLGCKVMRVLVSVKPEMIERCIPIAEECDVKMGLEIHSPFHFDHPWIMRYTEMIARTGTRHVGYIPDMGIFVKRYPRVMREHALRSGATERIVNFVCEAYEERVLPDYVIFDAAKMGGNEMDRHFAESIRHIIWSNPRRMLEFMPHIYHIHAKFYDMVDDMHEYSIPYEEIIPVLIDGAYSGYLSSEYEGNRWIQDAYPVDSVEQVRRQHAMFERLLAQQ